jgi:anti-sigma B factor antagonist
MDAGRGNWHEIQPTNGSPRSRVLVVEGEIDAVHERPLYEMLASMLRAPGVEQVIVDLSGVTYLDSSGLRALISAQAVAEKAELIMMSPSRAVSTVFELTSMKEVLHIVE